VSISHRQRAYPVRQAPIPFSAATLYRWEAKGLIRLVRVGGHTMITDEEVTRILEGKAAIPDHPSRQGHPKIQPKGKRRGRPRKHPQPNADPLEQ
jgi:hypothetical protein